MKRKRGMNGGKTMSETQALPKKSGTFFKTDIDSLLVGGEQVVIRAVVSPFIYWQSGAVFLLSLVVALVVWQLGGLLAVTAAVMFAYAAIRKEILLLVVTNKRVLARYGILQVDVVDIRFSKIESVELERMPTGYLMGYANLIVMGTGQRYITIPYVANAAEIRQAYNRLTLSDDAEDKDGE
jgi:hypothetical protein